MPDPEVRPSASDDVTSADGAIAEYLRRREQGDSVNPQELIERYPQCKEELAEFFETYEQMERFATKVSSSRKSLMHWASPGMRVRYVGDYEIIGPVGYGGMGAVYKARQISLDRSVALKMILDRDHDRDRFRREAEAAAALDHPNIVPIYEIGEYEGWPYYSMRLIEGGDLCQWMNPPVDEFKAAQVVSKLAKAVHHAHRRGVLHRDLKPGNVLLDEHGEPQITDFGLAKLIDQKSHATRSGSILGTPAFMSPEQASGNGREITTSTDVYGLGAVLYALVTGRGPFEADNALTVLRQVERDPPIPPRNIREGISADLNTICLKCLEKEPRLRYDTAEALADDLDRLLRGEPVKARPIRRPERTWRWLRRNPITAALLLSTALLLAILAIGGPWLAAREYMASQAAQKSRDAAVQAREQVESRMADVFISNGHRVRSRLDWSEARLWYLSAAQFAPDRHKQIANWIRAASLRTLAPPPVRSAMFSGESMDTFEFHPTGRYLLCGDRHGRFVIWDLQGNQAPRAIGELNHVSCAAWSPDGTTLAAGTEDGIVAQLASTDFKLRWSDRPGGRVRSIAFDSTGRRIACCFDNSVAIWIAADEQQKPSRALVYEASKELLHVEFRPAGDRLLVQDGAGVTVLDVGDQARFPVTPLFEPVPHVPPTTSTDSSFPHARFLDDESFLTIQAGSIEIHDAASGINRRSLATGAVHSIALTGSSGSIVVGGRTSARLWHQGPRPAKFKGTHREPVNAIAVHPNGKNIATGSLDGQVRLWSPDRNRPFAGISHPAAIAAVRFSPDGRLLATAQVDGLMRVWSIDHKTFDWTELIAEIQTGRAAPLVSIAPDGKHWFISRCNPDEAIGAKWQLYSMSGEVAEPALELDGPFCAAAMSPNGEALATVALTPSDATRQLPDTPSRLRFWKGPSREPAGSAIELPTPPVVLAYRPDGRQVAVLTRDGDLRLIDPKSAGPHGVLAVKKPTQPIVDPLTAGLLYLRDGSSLISWNGGAEVAVWSTDTGKPRFDPMTLSGPCTFVALSEDEQWLATATAGGDVRVWDPLTGHPASAVIPHAGRVHTVRFSPDGEQILTACEDCHVRTIQWRKADQDYRSFNARSATFDAAFFPNGQWFVTASDNNPCTLHDARDGQLMFYLNSSSPLVGITRPDRRIRFTFSPDGRFVLTAGERVSVRVFDLGWMADGSTADWKRLLWEAELTGGRRIVDGTATPIPSAEWIVSWREFARCYPVTLDFGAAPK